MRSIFDVLGDLFDLLGSLAENIVNPLKAFFEWLFVPDRTQIETKFQDIRSKYGFVDSVIETGDALGGVFSRSTMADQEPPVIYIDFGAAETEYSWGGKMKILDLSWYSRYKPTVDVLLKAIIWTFFFWRIYMKLPDIISGNSMSVDDWGNTGTMIHQLSGTPGKFEKSSGRYKGKFEK